MKTYHKIQTVFKRDMENNGKTLLLDQFSTPEFAFLQHNEWEWTEKVDGTNIRIMIEGGRVSFGGKTDAASIPANLTEYLRQTFDPLTDRLASMFPEGACLYGEGCGPKIQKGGGNYGGLQFVLFDVLVGPWWLHRSSVEHIGDTLDLRVAPVIGSGTIASMVEIVSAGITSQWGDFQAEGIVARPAVDMFTRAGQRVITKLKTRDFVR